MVVCRIVTNYSYVAVRIVRRYFENTVLENIFIFATTLIFFSFYKYDNFDTYKVGRYILNVKICY